MVQAKACNGKTGKIDFLEYGKKELHKRPNKGMYTSDALVAVIYTVKVQLLNQSWGHFNFCKSPECPRPPQPLDRQVWWVAQRSWRNCPLSPEWHLWSFLAPSTAVVPNLLGDCAHTSLALVLLLLLHLHISYMLRFQHRFKKKTLNVINQTNLSDDHMANSTPQ